MITLAGSGHRPDKLIGGYDNCLDAIVQLLTPVLAYLDVDKVHSGMALGYDTALALAALRTGKELHCQIPFNNFESRWTSESKRLYYSILDKASNINYVNPDNLDNKGEICYWLQKRNEILVDNCDVLLVLWDGTTGGTNNCINYSLKKRKTVINLWDLYYAKNKE